MEMRQTAPWSSDAAAVVVTERAGAKTLGAARKTGVAVGAGLQNAGNTCYANAALQCLTYTPALASWAACGRPGGAAGQRPCCRTCGVRAHISRALRHPGQVIAPCRSLLEGFHRQRQEDAHEFLMFTLGAMQEACADAAIQGRAPAAIQDIFGGRWRSRIQCLRCLAVSDTFDPYLDVTLDVGAAESVAQALQELVKPERLDGENAYLCGSCGHKAPATKTLSLHTASRVLMLVLKRFCPLSGAKLAGLVRYPEYLDVSGCTSERQAAPLDYVLYAVLVHSGWSCRSGHYLSYIKAAEGQWYQMDDARVSPCDVARVLGQQAYVLFYAHKAEWERGVGAWRPTAPECGGCGSSAGPGDCPGLDSAPAPPARGGHPDAEHSAPEHPEACDDAPAISLDDWRRLQEHSRPGLPLSLRKPAPDLPANAVVIHGPRHGHGAPRELNELQKDSRKTCSKAAMRKHRKGQKTLLVVHSLQAPRGYRL